MRACSPEPLSSPYQKETSGTGAARASQTMITPKDINPGLQRDMQESLALADISSPAHGAALIRNMTGVLNVLVVQREPDAMLLACRIMDRMKSLHGYLDAIERWASYVSTAYPDDVPPKGAALWE